jgi:hypothetical protein
MPAKYTIRDWDETRAAFASSIMVNTAISSLAQNLDGPDWPLKGKDETPAKYIDLAYEEVIEYLALKGQPPERIDQLVGILKDTLSFDDPFGDMVSQTEETEKRDNQMLRNMARLEIPESFPIAMTALSKETLEFCKLEKLGTLGEFAIFAQGMAQNVIVGGDFRKLLNALSHVDEQALSEVLPFRPGAKGLHLIEALGLATGAAVPADRVNAALEQFPAEFTALKTDVAAGGSLSRHLMVLANPGREARVAELLKEHLRPGAGAEGARKGGFFSRLFKK